MAAIDERTDVILIYGPRRTERTWRSCPGFRQRIRQSSGQPPFDDAEMFDDFGDRPSIGRRALLATRTWDAVDGLSQSCTIVIEMRNQVF
jgi:hypothetical protein